MLHKTSTTSCLLTTLCFVALFLSACRPAAVEQPPALAKLATPTPEIFAALAPSPTPSRSALPLTCQVTDLGVYIAEEWGYCFAYPGTFTVDESRAAEGTIMLYGPTLEDSADPLRVSLELTTQIVPAGSELTGLVTAYLTSFRELSGGIQRGAARLGPEPAEMLELVPGLLSARVMLALHENILFTLRFHPSDLEIAQADLEALTQIVTGSFAFLPTTALPVPPVKMVSWYEFGENISLSYDPLLAPWVEGWSVPAVPVSDEILYAEAHPAYAQIRFLGFQGGRHYDLPLLPLDDRIAQVRIFRTADFPGFGDEHPDGFVNQLRSLKDLLQTGLDPARCAVPLGATPELPFLPWINMKQTFCAQPEVLEFSGGKGIRYLSYYSQGPNPVVEREVFYTFQGLTDDGKFYVSAFFPVQTGIFPAEPPSCSSCADPFAEWTITLSEQLKRLNAQPADDFTPSLNVLDAVMQSLRIGTGVTEEVKPELGKYFQGFNGAFVLYDLKGKHYTRYSPEGCAERLLPASTFKIMNALIALDTGVIPDENYIIDWDGTQYPIAAWNQDHTLKTAFRNSVVWYYQDVAQRIGSERMQQYIDAAGYGNQDISGNLDSFWLDGALRISADEQVESLRRLYHGDLPFSQRSMEIVRDMMVVEKASTYTLRGKTGSGQIDGLYVGWFVGYEEVDGNAYFFAANISGSSPEANGPRAKEIVLRILQDESQIVE